MLTISSSPYAFTALDALRESGIKIASDGAEYKEIGKFCPIDATTNPSLVYAAICSPEYAHLVMKAVRYVNSDRSQNGREKTDKAVDLLLIHIAAEILAIIPGRVSISVDPRLGNSYDEILVKSRSLISLAEELHIPRSRILIKIPATVAGIQAAHTLESAENIHTNLTLIFSVVQALACAQAGVSVISPFVGRVKDWWSARATQAGNINGLNDQPIEEHPGIKLVYQIRELYTTHGFTTQVMAAGFRNPDEIVELCRFGAKGGPDLVTLPPSLLDALMQREGTRCSDLELQPKRVPIGTGSKVIYFTRDGPTPEGWQAYERDLEKDAIALDKLPEGLAKFSLDAVKLEQKISKLIEETTRSLARN